MGVTKRPNGTWLARYLLPGRREVSKTFRTRKEALAWQRDELTKRDRGQWVEPNQRITVGEYAIQWASIRPHRPSTAKNYASLIKHHIAATPLGKRRLADVRPSEVQAWATGRSKVMSPLRVRNLVSMLRAIYADAVLDRLVSSSPVVRVKLPSHDKPRIIPLTVEQVEALANAMPPRNRAMVIVQATTGSRIGELLALRVSDVDFFRRTVRVEYQFAPGSKIRTDTKTPRSRRTIPVPQLTIDTIAAHMAEFPPGEDGTLFVTRLGTAYRHDYYGSILFQQAVKAAGITARTTPHTLRHSYASWLLSEGESVVTVADRLGHNNAQTVLSVYAHIIVGAEDRTREAIARVWEAHGSRNAGRDASGQES